MKDVFTGNLVRLSAFDPQEMSNAFPRWNSNSEYFRLLNSSARPMQSSKAALKWMEEEVGEMPLDGYYFGIRTLAEDKLIGEIGLDVVNWPAGMPSLALALARPSIGAKVMAQT